MDRAASKKTPAIEASTYNLNLRVLLYKEDAEWVAHCLEMDLMGYGESEKKAIAELTSAIECQITFAQQKKDASLLQGPAPKELFKRWDSAANKAIRSTVSGDKTAKLTFKAIFISIKPPQEAPKSKGFERINIPCCA